MSPTGQSRKVARPHKGLSHMSSLHQQIHFVGRWSISEASLTLVEQRLYAGEIVVWTGGPDPVVKLHWMSHVGIPLAKVFLPVFLVAYIVGALIKDPILTLSMPVGFIVCLAIVMGVKGVRMMPVAHEEYALTNRRAFSIFNCNGTTLVGDMWLDSHTSIQTRRCGQKNKSVIFTRRQVMGPAEKHQTRSF